MTRPTVNPLVLALAGGEPESYAALYDRLGRSLLRVARVMMRDSAEAEDVVQDVFVELVRHRGRLARVQDLDAYIFAMLRYAVGRRIKRRLRELQHLHQLAPVNENKPSLHLPDDLEVALKSLPPEQREVVSLKVDAGLTFVQIAEVLGVNPNTAASRYRYALAKLREVLA